jgi:hypothetical protein
MCLVSIVGQFFTFYEEPFGNLITYLDDPIIILDYQYLSSNKNLIKTAKNNNQNFIFKTL